MENRKKLLRLGLTGLGISVLLIQLKDSVGSKIVAVLAAVVFLYMIVGYYRLSKKKH